jgi:hypothetical protein
LFNPSAPPQLGNVCSVDTLESTIPAKALEYYATPEAPVGPDRTSRDSAWWSGSMRPVLRQVESRGGCINDQRRGNRLRDREKLGLVSQQLEHLAIEPHRSPG